MANRRIVLQAAIEITSSQKQETRFAVPTMGAKTALVWVNVLKNTSSTAIGLKLIGASSLSLGSDGDVAGSFWEQVGIVSPGANTVGAFLNAVTTVPDFLRWEAITVNGTVQFEFIVYLYDT